MPDGLYIHFKNFLGYWLRCGAVGCSQASPLADDTLDAVAAAREVGWSINEFRALCPEHRGA